MKKKSIKNEIQLPGGMLTVNEDGSYIYEPDMTSIPKKKKEAGKSFFGDLHENEDGSFTLILDEKI